VLRVLVTPIATNRAGSRAVAGATAPARRPVLTQKASVAAAAEAIRAFIDAQCILDRNAWEQASVLREAYGSWASTRNMPRLGGRVFGMALGALGYERRKSCNILWCGLRLERRKVAP
ncbi:hypothetical protein, partial [Rhodoplanes sp. SY1]|uniref:hypothetical protein n=1 Tax=Rhodoplanes sp. SY1 TaxID=3166646 RepID=UPI0038B454A0